MCSKTVNTSSLEEVISFKYPKLYTGKDWYIGFYAYDPAKGEMRRKRIRINNIEGITKRRQYASSLISRISQKLEQGWNPWIEEENSKAYHFFTDVCRNYSNYIQKQYNDGTLRNKTMVDYLSRLSKFTTWNAKKDYPITYIYQCNRSFIQEFLDFVYIEENNSPRTRNNYLTWLSTFSSYLVQKMYLKEKPTEGIIALRVSKKKNRDIIKQNDLTRLYDFLTEKDKYFLLACYILHYALIRPKEMSYLKIKDFSIKRQTIFISGDFSKNKQDAIVTLPNKIVQLMIDLKIFDNPGEYYLFSDNFKPGKKRKSERQFREFWTQVIRKELNFPESYKFYSLKDTGITNMLRECDVISVRDQARHSSILMTNIYTPQDIQSANELIKNYKGTF